MNPPIFKKGKKKMRNRNNHDLTFKKKLSKCDKVFRAFSELQVRYGDLLDRNDDISEVKANVLLKEFELGEFYAVIAKIGREDFLNFISCLLI